MASPENVALVVTSNIRHLVAESRQEMDDALHPNERRDDALALADRFGLSLFFDEPSFEDYCHLVLSKAVASGLLKTMPKDWLHRWSAWQVESREAVREPPSQDLKILLKAQRFSRDRASRSGRTAQQFVDLLARQIL